MNIAKHISYLTSSIQVIACFEALCGVRSVADLLQKVPSVCSASDAAFVDKKCTWKAAKNWPYWWTRSTRLKMLSQVFSQVPETWSSCPATTNAVERTNGDCKSDSPQPLKLAMINVYKIDKCTCFKHIAAEQGASISYRRETVRRDWKMLQRDNGKGRQLFNQIKLLNMAPLTGHPTLSVSESQHLNHHRNSLTLKKSHQCQ